MIRHLVRIKCAWLETLQYFRRCLSRLALKIGNFCTKFSQTHCQNWCFQSVSQHLMRAIASGNGGAITLICQSYHQSCCLFSCNSSSANLPISIPISICFLVCSEKNLFELMLLINFTKSYPMIKMTL